MEVERIPSRTKRKKPRKRVAAYVRVSTSSEDQEESFRNQKAHFEALFLKHPEWEVKGIYEDKGVSGLSIAKRTGFQNMIADARRGDIDLILVKSISR